MWKTGFGILGSIKAMRCLGAIHNIVYEKICNLFVCLFLRQLKLETLLEFVIYLFNPETHDNNTVVNHRECGVKF